MFDYVLVEDGILPEELSGDKEWQTKAMNGGNMDTYIIKKDKRLYKEWYDLIPNPEYDPDAGFFSNNWSLFIRGNENIEDVNYHGMLRFYGGINGAWTEVYAKFTDGNLVDIKIEQEGK